MNKKELWAIINVNDVVRNTDVEKVLKCYDFKTWEKEEILNVKNDTDLSLNEFRWNYIKETLEITDSRLNEVGCMVRDLIDDIKMGYHRLSDEDILKDIENDYEISNIYDKAKGMHFEYQPFRDYETCNISMLHIYFDCDDLSFDEKKAEIEELISYLQLDNGQALLLK